MRRGASSLMRRDVWSRARWGREGRPGRGRERTLVLLFGGVDPKRAW